MSAIVITKPSGLVAQVWLGSGTGLDFPDLGNVVFLFRLTLAATLNSNVPDGASNRLS